MVLMSSLCLVVLHSVILKTYPNVVDVAYDLENSDRSWLCTILYSEVQYSTVQYSTVQYSAVQYSTVQYSTVQYSTVQYSAAGLVRPNLAEQAELLDRLQYKLHKLRTRLAAVLWQVTGHQSSPSPGTVSPKTASGHNGSRPRVQITPLFLWVPVTNMFFFVSKGHFGKDNGIKQAICVIFRNFSNGTVVGQDGP